MTTFQETWVFPCNVKYFDVFKHFSENNTVIWKRRGAVHKDDIVYIYVGAPYKGIRFKCHVVNEDVDEDVVQKNQYAIPKNSTGKEHYVELELDKEFEDDTFPLKELKENDLGQVQIPARASRKLRSFLERGED